jgi:hypothetical protein
MQVVKLLQNGEIEWEQGSNRGISLPALSPLLASCGAVKVSCHFGDASATLVHLVGDQAKLQVGGSRTDVANCAAVACKRRGKWRMAHAATYNSLAVGKKLPLTGILCAMKNLGQPVFFYFVALFMS